MRFLIENENDSTKIQTTLFPRKQFDAPIHVSDQETVIHDSSHALGYKTS